MVDSEVIEDRVREKKRKWEIIQIILLTSTNFLFFLWQKKLGYFSKIFHFLFLFLSFFPFCVPKPWELQWCWNNLDVMVYWLLLLFCRRVKFLHLEGCSLLTTEGLESVIHSRIELQSLRVVSCKNIKDSEISPALATLFTTLGELRWRPDTKSLLPSSLVGISMGKRGGRFFKRTWKYLSSLCYLQSLLGLRNRQFSPTLVKIV